MFCTRVAWACLVCLLLCKEEVSSPVSLKLLRKHMNLYKMPMSMFLLGFGMGTMLANFHMCGIMLVLSPRGLKCFRCLMFSLPRPCVFISLLCFIFSWTCVVLRVILYPCILCVALLMDLFVLCVACL